MAIGADRLGKRLERARLTRLPRRATRDEYDAASSELLARLERLPGVVSIYRTGSVSVPGISDLDYIVVVEGKDTVPPVWPELSERTRYLAMHAPMLIDVDRFARHRGFAHAEPLVLAAGEPLSVEPRPVPEYSERLIAAEGLLSIMLRILKQAATGRIKVRPSLCEAGSLKYDLELGGIDRSRGAAPWAAVERIALLRERWFEGDPKDIRPVLRDALRASMAAVGELDGIGGGSRGGDARRLRGAWRNVTVEPGGEVRVSAARALLPLTLSARGRWDRGGELGWRSVRCAIALPAAVFALLTGEAPAEYREFREWRDGEVRAYRDFIAERARGYSMMGLAGAFT